MFYKTIEKLGVSFSSSGYYLFRLIVKDEANKLKYIFGGEITVQKPATSPKGLAVFREI